MTKNILLVGGAGFIGSYVAEKLLEDNWQITIADNLLLGKSENINHLLVDNQVKFIKADFANFSEVEAIFKQGQFDVVYHLAANSDIQASAKDPKIDYNNTFLTTFNILECMKLFNVKKILFSSTSAIYGEKVGVNISEDIGPLFPISYYGGAKLASESFIASYAYMNDFTAWIFRFPNVIGGRLTHGVLFDFIKRLRENSYELYILGDGNQTKPYLYVKDLVKAMFLIWEQCSERINFFNIGAVDKTSVTEIANIITEEMGLKDVRYLYSGGNVGWKGDVPEFQYDLSKIFKLGWKPSYSSNEAVRVSVKEYLALCAKQ
ncbi:MAG: NAD-dependent epimerase/dehydratase family protein [Candidatus Margulisiibacteriota bacterium]